MHRFVIFFYFLICLFQSGCGPDYMMLEQPHTDVAIDSVILPEVSKLDILSVVDTSCSMNDGDTNRIADGLVQLRQDIAPITQDYQFGFINAASNSTFYGPLLPASADIDFRMIVNTFAFQSGAEVPFASLYDYVITDGTFIRPDADLLIFIFSDEKEQTSVTAQEMHSWLTTRWLDKHVDVVTIVPTDIQNDGQHEACGEIDQKYFDFSRLFGRSPIDLCYDDWTSWLSESSFLTSTNIKIMLTGDPVDGSIVVYVDHLRTHDFTYIENENAVQLDYTPDPGALIEVGYKIEN